MDPHDNRTSRRNSRETHKSNGHYGEDSDRCPWCGSILPRADFQRAVRQAEIREAAIRRDAIETATIELAAKIDEAVATERSKMVAERVALEAKLGELQRRVRADPAHILGEPAEQNLHARLVEFFPADQVKVTRVGKGVKGPDLHLEILDAGGAPIGRVVIEIKNAKWSRRFISKLKGDAAGADFGIISTTILPAAAGGSRLYVEDGVIIADPSLVPPLVGIMRRQIIEARRQRLTAQARDAKAEALLTFIASNQCRDQFDRLGKISADLTELDAKEAGSHETVWRRRGDLLRSLTETHAEFIANVDRIIAGNFPEAAS